MPENKRTVCIAVDDEPPALDVLKSHISAVQALELAGTCNNAIEAFHILLQKKIDLLFLDINLPQLSGIDLLRTLKNPPKVIFTTAYRKYAVEGFELDAVDFLLKPISFERFVKAVNKVIFYDKPLLKPEQDLPAESYSPFIYFRADRKIIKVALEEILFIESLKDYIKVVTKSKTIITRQSISSLQFSLPKNLFIRVHRSFIVALNKIDTYNLDCICIKENQLPVSRMYRHEVDNILQQLKGEH